MQRSRGGSVRPSLPPSEVARASPVKAWAKWKWIRRRRPSSQPGEEGTYFSPSGQLEFSGSGRQPQQMADALFSLIAWLVSLKGHLPLPCCKLNQGGAGFCGDCDWPQQVQAPVHQFFRRESATLCGSQPVDDPPHPCVLHIAQLVGNEVHPLHQ